MLAFDIPVASATSVIDFQQMANAFVESKTDIRDIYWPGASPSASFQGPDVSESVIEYLCRGYSAKVTIVIKKSILIAAGL